MPEYTCRIIIEDTIEAQSKEEAQRAFLEMLDELGASHFFLPRDVKVEEVEA